MANDPTNEQADLHSEVEKDLGRAGIPIGPEALPGQRPTLRIFVNKRRLVIMLCAAALGLAVGFLGLDDSKSSSPAHSDIRAP